MKKIYSNNTKEIKNLYKKKIERIKKYWYSVGFNVLLASSSLFSLIYQNKSLALHGIEAFWKVFKIYFFNITQWFFLELFLVWHSEPYSCIMVPTLDSFLF